MTLPIPISLAAEDDLSESVLRRILSTYPGRFAVGNVFGRSGFGYLKKQVSAFNNAAKHLPFLLLTDLDRYECPPSLLADWLSSERHKHFLLRVAVREVESWLLGDPVGLSRFLRLRRPTEIVDPERLHDAKNALLACAVRSPSRSLRESLVSRSKQSGRLLQGPDYNGTLARFVFSSWDLDGAKRKCLSLSRLCGAIERLATDYDTPQ